MPVLWTSYSPIRPMAIRLRGKSSGPSANGTCWLRGGLLVLEHRGNDQPESCEGLDLVRNRTIGDTALSFFRPTRPDRSGELARSEQPASSEQPVVAATVNRPEVLPIDLPPPSSRTPAMKVAVYPGTFDPVTNGHLDVLRQALNVFDRVVVAVATNLEKHPMFFGGGSRGPVPAGRGQLEWGRSDVVGRTDGRTGRKARRPCDRPRRSFRRGPGNGIPDGAHEPAPGPVGDHSILLSRRAIGVREFFARERGLPFRWRRKPPGPRLPC